MNFNHAYCLLCFVLFLSGCAQHSQQLQSKKNPGSSQIPRGQLDFGWKLSGDRAVAPLQVFSDNSHTWLHWNPNQVIPVILARQDNQEHVLTYTRQDPYTLIEGHWPKLSFRAGRQQAHARRVNAQTMERMRDPSPASVSTTTSDVAADSAATSVLPSPPSTTRITPSSRAVFSVSPEDRHLRQALVRWSGISGWRFQPEHWGTDVDIPLTAAAHFSDDFIGSVQALVSSTELSDKPLQPCFYSNQVLRVISAAELCDRTVVAGGQG